MYLVSRTTTFAKLFFLLIFCGLTMYAVLAFYSFHTALTGTSKTEKARAQDNFEFRKRFESDIKYILLWTIPEVTYQIPADGQRLLIQNNCSYINCYITTNKDLLNKNIKNFDAIVFSVNVLKNWDVNIPTERSKTQKYVFFSTVSAEKNPVCHLRADDFFNWTWTYKTNSDIATPFVEVRDILYGDIVAPKTGLEIATLEDTLEFTQRIGELNNIVNNTVSSKFNKSKAVMWYVEKCDMKIDTVTLAWNLKRELEGHVLELDIYGCGYKKCPEEGCLKMLERDYFFYLALEDSVSEDYVTTEVLKAYHHNAVPIVSGGADNYKFLPAGSYIDAQNDSIERVAATILYAMKLPSAYERYFLWKKRFTIHKAVIEKGYCTLCAMLNDEKKMKPTTGYKMFRKWWYYGSLRERCIPKGAEQLEELLSYMKSPSGKRNRP